MASAEYARIEVPKALRSDMEAPKALNGVKSGEGVETHFGILFGHRTLLGIRRKMRFLAFLISGFWSAGALAFRGGGVPPSLATGLL